MDWRGHARSTLRALSWGPQDGPIALCLHGFPDTAHGWRKLAPRLVAGGWRVVTPFTRGYVPSSIPLDGSYHIAALMDDALQVLNAAGPTGGDVVIGHDWGAIAAAGLGDMPDRGRLAALLSRQVLRSWYTLYFQLPWLPERSASWIVPLLWRRWSPGYDAEEDLRHVDAAIGAPDNWGAALGPYRATLRGSRPPARYAALHSHWLSSPVLPSLYLHGTDDGCMTTDFAHWVHDALPSGSDVAVVEHAGHFLALEQPEKVSELILDFIGSAP